MEKIAKCGKPIKHIDEIYKYDKIWNTSFNFNPIRPAKFYQNKSLNYVYALIKSNSLYTVEYEEVDLIKNDNNHIKYDMKDNNIWA